MVQKKRTKEISDNSVAVDNHTCCYGNRVYKPWHPALGRGRQTGDQSSLSPPAQGAQRLCPAKPEPWLFSTKGQKQVNVA